MDKSHPSKTDKQKRDRRFAICKSALYHDYRRKFFLTAHFIGPVVGSTAIAKIGGQESEQWVLAICVVSSSIAQVFGFSDKANKRGSVCFTDRHASAGASTRGETLHQNKRYTTPELPPSSS